jgi:hypothetical protein
MTRPELKTEIVAHLLGHIRKKPLLEMNEKVCNFYEEDPNGREELDAALDEVYDELVKQYNVDDK